MRECDGLTRVSDASGSIYMIERYRMIELRETCGVH